MGCWYKVSGAIPLKAVPSRELVGKLCEDLSKQDGIEVCLVSKEGEPQLAVLINSEMSYGSACNIDAVLEEFARGWAARGAVLETDCDGETNILRVGPDTVSEIDAEIAYVEERLAALFTRRDELRLEKAKIEGDIVYGN
jgi:hypothetical protein